MTRKRRCWNNELFVLMAGDQHADDLRVDRRFWEITTNSFLYSIRMVFGAEHHIVQVLIAKFAPPPARMLRVSDALTLWDDVFKGCPAGTNHIHLQCSPEGG